MSNYFSNQVSNELFQIYPFVGGFLCATGKMKEKDRMNVIRHSIATLYFCCKIDKNNRYTIFRPNTKRLNLRHNQLNNRIKYKIK